MFKKNLIALFIILLGLIVVSCSSGVKVDWDAVNKAFDENRWYQTKSIAEAEKIVDFSVATFENVPEEFNQKPNIMVFKEKVMAEEPRFLVQQDWNHKKDQYSISLTINSYPSKTGGENVNITEINGIEVETQRINNSSNDRPDVYGIMWFDGELNYNLIGFISETLTEQTYIDLAKSLINKSR